MQFAIGIDHFGEVIRGGSYFADKTLFIKEILSRYGEKVTLITRPRRFGKTLNLSMLQHFLASEIDGLPTRPLFEGLAIAHDAEMMKHQGKYPVIFITFKDVKTASLEGAEQKIVDILSKLYESHAYLREDPNFSLSNQMYFDKVLQMALPAEQLGFSLLRLSQWIEEYHHQKPWLLIDEYDAPLHSAYLYNYHEELLPLIRTLFGAVLKTNPHLNRAVLTGVTRIAKESLFSGLNNPAIYTLLDSEYSTHFGFTEVEVEQMLAACRLTSHAEEIKAWYNGYLCDETLLYNPWSIINCLSRKGKLGSYWVNTGGTDILQKRLLTADSTVKMALEGLIQNRAIEADIHTHWTFDSLTSDLGSICSLLLAAGYLKPVQKTLMGSFYRCQLQVPNKEVMTAYTDIIMTWFKELGQEGDYQALLKALVQGDMEVFHRYLNTFLAQTVSYFDVTGVRPERFYHGFVLGLIVALSDTHVIESNRESGLGRYDVMIIPKDTTQYGLVIEFKVAFEGEDLKHMAETALEQVRRQQYATTLKQRGIQRILLVGMAFLGKKADMVWIEEG